MGIDHEENGRDEYMCKCKFVIVTLSVLLLVLSPIHHFLIWEEVLMHLLNDKGLLEIKCPFSCKEGITDDLNGKRSFLNENGLVKSHKYYCPH